MQVCLCSPPLPAEDRRLEIAELKTVAVWRMGLEGNQGLLAGRGAILSRAETLLDPLHFRSIREGNVELNVSCVSAALACPPSRAQSSKWGNEHT